MTETKGINEVKADLVENGIDKNKLREKRINWALYMQAGVLPKIVSKRWRGRGRLTGSDLGVADLSSHMFRLGSKLLLPRVLETSAYYDANTPDRTYAQLLDSVEKSARMRLESLVFTTAFGPFLPVKNFKEWRTLFAAYKYTAYEIVQEMVADWDLICDAILLEYADEAAEAFERHAALDKDHGIETDYISNYLADIKIMLPDASSFETTFRFDDEYEFIPLPAMIAEDLAKAEESALMAESKGFEAEELRAQRLAMRSQNDALSAEIEEMKAEVIGKVKQDAQAQASQFVDDILTQMRKMIMTVAADVQKSLGKNGRMASKSRTQIKNMIDRVRQMNFMDDEQVNGMLADLEGKIGGTDTAPLESTLSRVSEWCEVQIADIRRVGRLDIDPEEIEIAEIESRREAGRSAVEPIAIDVPVSSVRQSRRFADVVAAA